mmetsp:Transcript_52576/g.87062  ORF Transcript_52576/g.87062 Transcript_52576/m.87062 type:complete len:347 (+) Transcript_52576:81-1121(+)
MPTKNSKSRGKSDNQRTMMMNVSNIRFTQKSVNDTFSSGAPIKWTIHMLQTKQIEPCEIPLIRVGKLNGHYKSIDNRRLYCFKQSGIKKIPVTVMQELTLEFHYKNQSPNNGTSVQVIHDPKPKTHHQNKVTAHHPTTHHKRTWTVKETIELTKLLQLREIKEIKAKTAANEATKRSSMKHLFLCKVCNRCMEEQDKHYHLEGASHKAALRRVTMKSDTVLAAAVKKRNKKHNFLCDICNICMHKNDKHNHLQGASHKAALRRAAMLSDAAQPAAVKKRKTKNAGKSANDTCSREVCEEIKSISKPKVNTVRKEPRSVIQFPSNDETVSTGKSEEKSFGCSVCVIS